MSDPTTQGALDVDVDGLSARLAGAPVAVLAVARTLHDAGFAAVLVGGAVRDALCGCTPTDWDLASSATPQEVQSLFRRTIPTGAQHGTVTVLSGHGEAREAVEVTTFRGEGAYEDGRRPTEVRFLRDLEEDLARRDFTINAFAWDPATGTLTDIYGGIGDLRARRVRAVGEPLARFREDGLRTMRAVRFAAALDFEIEKATQAAIPLSLDVFDRVSRERVRVELLKLLGARRPSRGLLPMACTGLWDRVLLPLDGETRRLAIEACDQLGAQDPILRLARLLWPRRAEVLAVKATLAALKPSRQERDRILALLAPAGDALGVARDDPYAIRRAAAALGREHLVDLFSLIELGPPERALIEDACRGAALTTRELALQGRDLISEGVMRPGPRMGEVLDMLLAWVLEDPARNERSRLLAHARSRR